MVNNFNFNKIWSFELLKKEEFVINKRTSLLDENRDQKLELMSYTSVLENQINSNRKNI